MKRLARIGLIGFAGLIVAGLMVFILLTAISLSTVRRPIHETSIRNVNRVELPWIAP